MQRTIATPVRENNKLSGDVADLRHNIAKNNDEVEKLKGDFIKQNQYVASLELKLECEKKLLNSKEATSKTFKKALTSLNNIPVKILLKFTASIPEDIGISTDEVICKVASAVGVQIAPENLEISHRLYRKKGTKPIIAKFSNHKGKAKLY